ncbi:FMRFamide receptor-like [Lingula anatina]|uniref:FMRFamide receptor-like n=1 Tax=Lingula anatina TaxID=7574 RepID=A0A1S3IHA8_LINAN|nr:FMRFamide receptor-like [Lingula anatina]|eukprot:XP_013397597.1 FMRFamide receptor-like [Lingula anatina]
MGNFSTDPYRTLNIYPESLNFYTFLVGGVIGSIICLVGIIFNTTSILVFARMEVQSGTSFLLICLAVNDNAMLLCQFIMYNIPSLYPYTGWFESYFHSIQGYYKYVWGLNFIPGTIVIYLAVFVTLERHNVVCSDHLDAGPQQAPSKWYLPVFALVVLGTIFNLPKFLDTDFQGHRLCGDPNASTTVYCFMVPTMKQSPSWRLYQILYRFALYVIFLLFVPVSVVVILNVKILRRLRERSSAFSNARRNGRASAVRNLNQNELTKIVVIIVALMSLTQFFTSVAQFMHTFTEPTEANPYTFPLLSDVVMLNSAVNFFIYGLFGSKFREHLKEMVCFCRVRSTCWRNSNPRPATNGERNVNVGMRIQSVTIDNRAFSGD